MSDLQTATFAAGCFWGVEAAFAALAGVVDTAVGYTGGQTEEPSYKQVCSGTTGHAECVQLRFAPAVVSYEDLLELFWDNHDPTQRNRQGPDVGTQYRSVIYYHDDAQRAAALASKAVRDASGKHAGPIVTEVSVARRFWRAEEYHQRYFEKNGISHCPI